MTLVKRSEAARAAIASYRAPSDPVSNMPAATPMAESAAAALADRPSEAAASDRPDAADLANAAIARLERRIAELEAERDRLVAKARDEGYAAGSAAAATREEERAALLGQALDRAVETVSARIGAERDIAVELARAALSRLFADPAHFQTMVGQTIALWSGRLSSDTIVGIRVSPLDFPDGSALDDIRAANRRTEIATDASLAAGACEFDLTLGRLDASIPQQAAAVEDRLRRFEPATDAA